VAASAPAAQGAVLNSQDQEDRAVLKGLLLPSRLFLPGRLLRPSRPGRLSLPSVPEARLGQVDPADQALPSTGILAKSPRSQAPALRLCRPCLAPPKSIPYWRQRRGPQATTQVAVRERVLALQLRGCGGGRQRTCLRAPRLHRRRTPPLRRPPWVHFRLADGGEQGWKGAGALRHRSI
jgi:hypothetical protein